MMYLSVSKRSPTRNTIARKKRFITARYARGKCAKLIGLITNLSMFYTNH